MNDEQKKPLRRRTVDARAARSSSHRELPNRLSDAVPPAALRRRRGRPPADSVEQARAVLLRTALEAFLHKGYSGASINDIARRSGISRDTLYRQYGLYGLKEELFRAATGYGLGLLAEHLRMAVAGRGSVEEVLVRAALQINSDMSSPDAIPILRLIIAEAHRFPDVAHRMFEDSRRSLAPLVDYLDAQRRAGVLALDDAFEAAFMLSTLAFGGVRIFLQHWPGSAGERERWVRQVVRYLLRGWQAAAPGGRGQLVRYDEDIK
jgi:AcrR family transcriptional regulator